MSFLGMGRAQPTSEQKIAAVEGEMRMMADTYNRLHWHKVGFDKAPAAGQVSFAMRLGICTWAVDDDYDDERAAPAQPSPAQPNALAVANIAAKHDSLQKSCQKKCIPTDYREGELNKGESVCLDRCTAKFLDTSMKVSEIMQQQGGAQQGAGGGATGGLF